jgi:hypothetical protein
LLNILLSVLGLRLSSAGRTPDGCCSKHYKKSSFSSDSKGLSHKASLPP